MSNPIKFYHVTVIVTAFHPIPSVIANWQVGGTENIISLDKYFTSNYCAKSIKLIRIILFFFGSLINLSFEFFYL